MKDYASLQEIDQKRIMEEENKKEIDATRPTQRELMNATKFEEKMSFRLLRDTRDENTLFKRMVIFKMNEWFKKKLEEIQEMEDKEFG